MRLLLAACMGLAVSPLWAAPNTFDMTPAERRAYQKVLEAEKELHLAGGNLEQANQKKAYASHEFADSVEDEQDLPDWRIISKAKAAEKTRRAQEDLARAKVGVKRADQAYVSAGEEYVEAEDEYRRATGEYYNPDQYRTWKGHLRYRGQTEEESQEEPSYDGAAKEAGRIQQLLAGSEDGTQLAPESIGEALHRSGQLGDMADQLVAQAMSHGAQAPTGPSLASADAVAHAARRDGPARGMSPSSEAFMGRRLLISGENADPRRSRARTDLDDSRDRLRKKDYRGALLSAEHAIAANPNDPRAHVLKAEALNSLGRHGEAEKAALRALKLDPDNSEAFKNMAWAQLHTGDYEEAAASSSAQIRLDPGNAQAYVRRAFAYEMLGKDGLAMADYKRAADLDPRTYGGHLANAKAGIRIFDPDARDTLGLLDALAPPPRGTNPVVLLGLVLLALAGGSLAVAALRRPRASAIAAGTRTTTLETRGPRVEEEAPEKLLGGKYRLERLIGRGGMGQVWEATDRSLERRTAVKQMASDLGEHGSQVRELFLKEASTLATLHHPLIVDIFEVLDLPEGLYLVFEWAAGKTLQQILAEKHRLPLENAQKVLKPVCAALTFAHLKGFVHRDLKPANIMVSDEGNVKLMDFGIAHALDRGPAPLPMPADAAEEGPRPFVETRTRMVAGTPAYRAPEAELGIVTPAFDVFSLGVCLHEMLTGELPFGVEGRPLEGDITFLKAGERVPGLPVAVDSLIARALEPDHRKRIQDAPSFLRALLET
ncbi:MAG: protein kinase [Elusimicrobiota bacterium]